MEKTRRGPRPVPFRLEETDENKLRSLLRRSTTRWGKARRVQALLALHESEGCVSAVARRLGMARDTIRRARDRWLAEGQDGLDDRARSGRPPEICLVTCCLLVAMACGKPEDYGVPFRPYWTMDSLLECFREFYPEVPGFSRTTLLRILNDAEIRPHRIQYWLHSPDPEFRAKVTAICDLYLQPPQGSVVVCVDEKTGMQALGRKHPLKPAATGRMGRQEYEYKRNGTRTLFAGFFPHTGQVMGVCSPTRTGEDLVEFMEDLASVTEGKHVHVVWDNLNTHFDGKVERWTSFNERHGGRFHFHHTPIHASWVNQVELFFGILQKRMLRYAQYDSVDELEAAVYQFLCLWNETEAKPFRWTYQGYPQQTGLTEAA